MKKAEKGKKKKEKEEIKIYTLKDLENILQISENDIESIDEKIGNTGNKRWEYKSKIVLTV